MSVVAASENLERQAFLGWQQAAQQHVDNTGWKIEAIGDALCSVSSRDPNILVNRVFGLGSRVTPTREQLVRIRELYAESGISRFFLHVVPDDLGPGGTDVLIEAGYKRYRGWMKFTRGRAAASEVTSELAIRRIDAEFADEFARVAGNAFDFEASFQPAIAALAHDPNWHLYMSFDGDRPAGTGGLYVRDDAGYLDFGATDPEFRRRGSQTAILNRRIRDALDAGCTSITTMTGEAVPGDEQHSYKNITRAGFEPAYLRENWVPETN